GVRWLPAEAEDGDGDGDAAPGGGLDDDDDDVDVDEDGEAANPSSRRPWYIVHVLVHAAGSVNAAAEGKGDRASLRPIDPGAADGEIVLATCDLSAMDGLSAVKVHVPKDLRLADARNGLRHVLHEDLGICDDSFRRLVRCAELIEAPSGERTLSRRAGHTAQMLVADGKRLRLAGKVDRCRKRLCTLESVWIYQSGGGHAGAVIGGGAVAATAADVASGDGDIIETKGRVACEVSVGDELVLTKLLLDGAFED
ncbi:ATP-dependent RNA helicase mtr4, partial [Cladochytrium tenue]